MLTMVIIALLPTMLMLLAIVFFSYLSGHNKQTIMFLVGVTILTAYFGVLGILMTITELFKMGIVSPAFKIVNFILFLITVGLTIKNALAIKLNKSY